MIHMLDYQAGQLVGNFKAPCILTGILNNVSLLKALHMSMIEKHVVHITGPHILSFILHISLLSTLITC